MSDIQMSNQEPEMPYQIHEQDLQEDTAAVLDSFDSSTSRFSLLCLSNLVPSSSPPAANNNNNRHNTCTKCGSSGPNNNPMKRRSPSSHLNPTATAAASFNESEPRPKKLFLESPPPPTPLDGGGFSKILLPFGSSEFGVPVLRRCVSDPFNPPAGQYPDPFSGSGYAVNLNPPNSPPLESVKMAGLNPVTPSSGTLPPLPPTLRRSVSDLNPSPSPAKSYSRLSGSAEMGVDESPNSKKMRRMRDRLREMNQSWLDFMNEEQEAYGAGEKENPTTKDESLAENEESVSVERVGECLIIHFKCPCGKGYQILLSGRNCYYKLM